jgi:hypothetical protein
MDNIKADILLTTKAEPEIKLRPAQHITLHAS